MPILRDIFEEYLARRDIPSLGYEPWLIERGVPPSMARLLAQIILRSGQRQEREHRRLPAAAKAIKVLATPGGHQKCTILRHAKLLLGAWEETSIIETIFDGAGLNETQFIQRLEQVVRGEFSVVEHLAATAAELLPHLPQTRGAKITAVSASHEFFLEMIVSDMAEGTAYTWNDLEQMYTDPATEASRREFELPWFDPRPAYRRMKAHQERSN